MKIGDLDERSLAGRLRGEGLRWRSGPFVIHLKGAVRGFIPYLRLMYGAHPVLDAPWQDIADFHVTLERDRGLRRWWQPKVYFHLDGASLLAPFPLDHAPPLFEWGWNFCIAGRANHLLVLHTAVVAKGGRAMILPGVPGCGKSTLAAALALRGWQLLSDEFALVRPEDGAILPLARPVALKNRSIAVIQDFAPGAVLGPEFPKTRKGTVAHLRPPAASVATMDRGVPPAWVVCPLFQDGHAPVLSRLPGEHAFLRLAANAFNYETRGAAGFQAVARIVRSCAAFELTYGRLEEAVAALDDLTGNA